MIKGIRDFSISDNFMGLHLLAAFDNAGQLKPLDSNHFTKQFKYVIIEFFVSCAVYILMIMMFMQEGNEGTRC